MNVALSHDLRKWASGKCLLRFTFKRVVPSVVQLCYVLPKNSGMLTLAMALVSRQEREATKRGTTSINPKHRTCDGVSSGTAPQHGVLQCLSV